MRVNFGPFPFGRTVGDNVGTTVLHFLSDQSDLSAAGGAISFPSAGGPKYRLGTAVGLRFGFRGAEISLYSGLD